jgi:hypothetical protein
MALDISERRIKTMKEIIEEAMTKRNKPVGEVKTCQSLIEYVIDVIESDELSDEERLSINLNS